MHEGITLLTRYSTLWLISTTLTAYLDVQNRCGFLEGRIFSSQSQLLESFSNYSDWLDKSQHYKKKGHFFYGHVNRL